MKLKRLLPLLIAASCGMAGSAQAAETYRPEQFASNYCAKSPDGPTYVGPEPPEGMPPFYYSKPVPRMLTDKLPLARIRSKSYPDGGSTDRDYAWLVLTTLGAHEKIVAYYREFLVCEGASDTLLALFDKAATWKVKICAEDPDANYRRSKKLRDFESDDPMVREYFSWVANYVFLISLSRFSPKAYFGSSSAQFDAPESLEDYCSTTSAAYRHSMRTASALNHVPAIRKMIRRCLDLGNRAEAYFWMLRARKLGLNVEDDIQALKPKLTDQDQTYLAKWNPDQDISSLGAAFDKRDFWAFMESYPNQYSDRDILCGNHRAN